MINEIFPSFQKFKKIGNHNQLIFKKIIADKETPVSIFEKVCGSQNNCFLLESVTGGENKARYSIIGMRPDLVWESTMGGCKIAENIQESSKPRFRELNNNPLRVGKLFTQGNQNKSINFENSTISVHDQLKIDCLLYTSDAADE